MEEVPEAGRLSRGGEAGRGAGGTEGAQALPPGPRAPRWEQCVEGGGPRGGPPGRCPPRGRSEGERRLEGDDRQTGVGRFKRTQGVDLVGCEPHRGQILWCGREPRPQSDSGQVLLDHRRRDEVGQLLAAELSVVFPGHGGP